MELAQSLLLNEDAYKKIAEPKRPVFIYEWLRFLDRVLIAAQKSDIKESQKKLINQLTEQLYEKPGPPTRQLLARCLATLYSVGDTFSLFETINKCNDIIKSKDDTPSFLMTKMAAIACVGEMYEKLGRMVGRSYEETVQLLIKALKNAESQGRAEIMITLKKVVSGMGSGASNCHKDIYKVVKSSMTDRSMSVRCCAAKCMYELVHETTFVSSNELDNVVSLCIRSLDGSNYEVRCQVSKLLAHLLAYAIENSKTNVTTNKTKQLVLSDVLGILSNGFLKGGTSFLKSSSAGEMIKGSWNVNREVRVGITHAYSHFVREMGGIWFERNMKEVIEHILNLVSQTKACPSHVDAVYARKCVMFILRTIIGATLSEKAQIAAAKVICCIIVDIMNNLDSSVSINNKDNDMSMSSKSENGLQQHVLVCGLHELSCLIYSLGTSAAPLLSEPSSGALEPVISVLIHPTSPAARYAAAWCISCIGVSLPSHITMLIDRCTNRMQQLKSSPEAISGYSSALAALIGGVRRTALGIPYGRGKKIFSIAEELLRTATQASRLTLQRIQSGWMLIASLNALGPSVVKKHLPKMLLLWRNAFPRSVKELEAEKNRGDAFTWQVSLESRAGALGAIFTFLTFCNELATQDVIRRILPALECALNLSGYIPNIIKMYGSHLKACAALLRQRLYDVLSLISPQYYENAFSGLLRELVAEFTLTDNAANTTTSLLRSLCHTDDSVVLGSWLEETDHKSIEDQLQPNSASGSGALEHDPYWLFITLSIQTNEVPGPLPLGVSVIDSSVRLYGLVFPLVAHKHRLQMLEHFGECIRTAKSLRQQAVQINIFTAVLCALRSLAETKIGFGQLEVRKAAVNLVLGALNSNNSILRCAAGEALGRMAQVVGENRFVAEMAQYSFDKLKSARDVVSRTGHSLALGCLHRYVGGMGTGQHLSTSISILLALAKDSSSPAVQVWALHGLRMVADCGGPNFRSYVEPSLSLILQLLLSVPLAYVDVHRCIGKCLAALVTAIGPELQTTLSGVITTARLSCLVCCAIMQNHWDSLVKSEAIACLQQLHMFAPKHVNLADLVPHLCQTLNSNHLLLRRAAVACLRQFVQKEARQVSEQALKVSDIGLEKMLFSILDSETDIKLCSDVQDTLISLLHSLADDNLTRWLSLIKDVLQQASSASSMMEKKQEQRGDSTDTAAGSDEVEGFQIISTDDSSNRKKNVSPRWPTRVFALECLLKIISSPLHFDFLLAHLSELIKMAFIAATSDSDKLRLVGLNSLQEIIKIFSLVPEPELQGHVILEQYQAQVSAALRPAFSADTAPHVTALACQVCSRWISSGVARDLNDLRRVYQLLSSSLSKLKTGNDQSLLYNESATTMEQLAVLQAWAQVYVQAIDNDRALLDLVQPEIINLSRHWLDALKDYALLSLPGECLSQLPTDGGAFYKADTIESCRIYYKNSWPPILYAVSLWLREKANYDQPPANMKTFDEDRLHLLIGVCLEALCTATSVQSDSTVEYCLKSLFILLDDERPRSIISCKKKLMIEILNVMHRLLLTRENQFCYLLALKVIKQILKAANENIKRQNEITETEDIGEGGVTNDIYPKESVIFATLENCLCIFMRYIPGINPTNSTKATQSFTGTKKKDVYTKEICEILSETISVLVELPSLCSPNGTLSIMPTLLYICLSIIRELAPRNYGEIPMVPIASSIHALKSFCCQSYAKREDSIGEKWRLFLRSATFSLLEYYYPKEDKPGMDRLTTLLCLTVFLVNCDSKTILNCKSIQTKAIAIFNDIWVAGNVDRSLRLQYIKAAITIFQHDTFYVHTLSPVVIELLTKRQLNDRLDADIICESMRLLESLIVLCNENTRIDLVGLCIPILIGLLTESTEDFKDSLKKQVHDHSLAKLKMLGSYPNEFREIMKKEPQFRNKLQIAIQAEKVDNKLLQENNSRSDHDTNSNFPTKPAIELKKFGNRM